MTLEQLNTLVKLMGGNVDSVAVKAAKLVLVEGVSQVDAAKLLGAKPNTINNGVQRYKKAHQEIQKVYPVKDK
jgi:transposase